MFHILKHEKEKKKNNENPIPEKAGSPELNIGYNRNDYIVKSYASDMPAHDYKN